MLSPSLLLSNRFKPYSEPFIKSVLKICFNITPPGRAFDLN